MLSVLEGEADELLPEDHRKEQKAVLADATIPVFTSYDAGFRPTPVPLSDPGLPIKRLKQPVKPGTRIMSAGMNKKRRAKGSFSVEKPRQTNKGTKNCDTKKKLRSKVLSVLFA